MVPDEGDRIVYERVLGRFEQPDSHRWFENYAPDCSICNKNVYTVFIWNKKLAFNKDQSEFYKHLDFNVLDFDKNYNSPVLSTKDKVFKMLPITEFIERLNLSKLQSSANRACDNEIEKNHFQDLVRSIDEQFINERTLQPTFWST